MERKEHQRLILNSELIIQVRMHKRRRIILKSPHREAARTKERPGQFSERPLFKINKIEILKNLKYLLVAGTHGIFSVRRTSWVRKVLCVCLLLWEWEWIRSSSSTPNEDLLLTFIVTRTQSLVEISLRWGSLDKILAVMKATDLDQHRGQMGRDL